MSTRAKIITIVILLLFIGGIAVTDAMVREKSLTSQLSLWLDGDQTGSGATISAPSGQQTSSAPVAVDANQVLSVMTARGFTYTASTDPSVLSQVAGSEKIESYTFLKDGDRAGSIYWISSPNAVPLLQALKESLLKSFSANLQDLRDETVSDPGKPVRNVLTFVDPGLSEERLIFVRTGAMLYEIHATKGKEDVVFPLVDQLTAQ